MNYETYTWQHETRTKTDLQPLLSLLQNLYNLPPKAGTKKQDYHSIILLEILQDYLTLNQNEKNALKQTTFAVHNLIVDTIMGRTKITIKTNKTLYPILRNFTKNQKLNMTFIHQDEEHKIYYTTDPNESYIAIHLDDTDARWPNDTQICNSFPLKRPYYRKHIERILNNQLSKPEADLLLYQLDQNGDAQYNKTLYLYKVAYLNDKQVEAANYQGDDDDLPLVPSLPDVNIPEFIDLLINTPQEKRKDIFGTETIRLILGMSENTIFRRLQEHYRNRWETVKTGSILEYQDSLLWVLSRNENDQNILCFNLNTETLLTVKQNDPDVINPDKILPFTEILNLAAHIQAPPPIAPDKNELIQKLREDIQQEPKTK